MTNGSKGDNLRDKISETAFKRFLMHGYDEVRIKDIAEECNISNSLLQHYYPRRADLVVSPFYSIIQNTLRLLTPAVIELTNGEEDSDLVCVNAFYHVFYSILHANHDQLLRLYTVILYDAISVKRATDMVLDSNEYVMWQGKTNKSQLGSYAVNGIMSQFVVVYFDNRLSSDLMSFVDMALDMNYDLLELSEERRAYVRAMSEKLMNDASVQQFIGDYLEYIAELTRS